MIWTILLIIATLIIFVLGVIVFIPFGVRFQFSNTSKDNWLNIFFLFGGFFLRVEYDFAQNGIIIRFFGRKLNFRKKDNSPKVQRDDKIEKNKITKTIPDEVEVEKKDEAKVADVKEEKVGTEIETSSAPSVATEINRSDFNSQDQGQSTESSNEVPKPEPQPQTEQKEKKERLIQTIERLKNRINKHPAVFFIKQEKLRYRGWRWIVRILKCILRIITIRRLLVRAELVFNDPALGGKLFGYYEGVRHAAALYSKKINLFFKPLFIEGETKVTVDFCATTSLWKIGYPLFVAVVTFPYLTFGITWWRFYSINRQQKKADAKRT